MFENSLKDMMKNQRKTALQRDLKDLAFIGPFAVRYIFDLYYNPCALVLNTYHMHIRVFYFLCFLDYIMHAYRV